MLFSILIPVYNVEQYLGMCLDAIINQTERSYEVILIDDGSTDGSTKICDNYCQKYPDSWKVIHKKNEGLLLARRDAIKLAQGEYVLFCDSDDYFEMNALEEIKRVFEVSRADVVIYNAYVVKKNKRYIFFENIFEKSYINEQEKNLVYELLLSSYKINSMWSKAVRRELIDADRDYSPLKKVSNGEDLLQSLWIFTKAKNIAYLNKALYNYRILSGMTTKMNLNYFNSFMLVNQEINCYENEWKLDDFKEKKALLFVKNSYDAVSQLRFGKKNNFKEKKELICNVINNLYWQNQMSIIYKSNYWSTLLKRQKVILELLRRKMTIPIIAIYELYLISKIWRNIE